MDRRRSACKSRSRGPDGRFQPYKDLKPSRLQALSAARVEPYYKTTGIEELITDMPSQMRRVYLAANPVAMAWVPLPTGAQQQLVNSITGLLDNIGGLLHHKALTRQVLGNPRLPRLENKVVAGSVALASPLPPQQQGGATTDATNQGPCMLLDKTKVAATPHVWWKAGGQQYLKVGLASVKEGDGVTKPTLVYEYAHRIVLWAMHGPPPANLMEPIVAMHTCHNPRCINPNHLVWGHEYSNLGNEANAHALDMMTMQCR
jgi:hypothetical protein